MPYSSISTIPIVLYLSTITCVILTIQIIVSIPSLTTKTTHIDASSSLLLSSSLLSWGSVTTTANIDPLGQPDIIVPAPRRNHSLRQRQQQHQNQHQHQHQHQHHQHQQQHTIRRHLDIATTTHTVTTATSPDSIPTITIASTTDCVDDETLRYKNVKQCKWVNIDAIKRCALPWQHTLLNEFCPLTCGLCPPLTDAAPTPAQSVAALTTPDYSLDKSNTTTAVAAHELSIVVISAKAVNTGVHVNENVNAATVSTDKGSSSDEGGLEYGPYNIARSMGTKTLLVIRVESPALALSLSSSNSNANANANAYAHSKYSGSTTASQDQLIQDIFGNEGTNNKEDGVSSSSSLVSQFRACSHGKLLLQPATTATTVVATDPGQDPEQGRPTTIKNGVVTVQLDESVVGRTTQEVYQDIEAQLLLLQFNGVTHLHEVVDFVMVCMPSGTLVSTGSTPGGTSHW